LTTWALVANLYGTAASDNERTEHFVNNFYRGAYGRDATSTEIQQQRDALNAAAAQSQAAVQSQADTFGRSLFAGQVNDSSISDTQFVTNLYEAFLQRGPDAGGLGWWSGQATVGTGRQNVLGAFAGCPAFRDLSGTLYREANWLVSDQLGTPRMIANKSGSLASMKRHDYLPFGEELGANIGGRTPTQGYAGDSVRQKFTSKERDNETGLDYFLARYYSSTQGRFTSPDEFTGGPENIYTLGKGDSEKQALPYAEITNPQSLNKYQYCFNNPLRYIDLDGHDGLLITNKDTGQTTLVIPVHFTGTGATPELIAAIVKRDNELDTGGSGVKIEVVATDKPINGVLNNLDLSPGLDKNYPPAGEGVNGPGGNRGHINSATGSADGAAAHDVLHLAGIKDQYKEGRRDANGQRTSTPKKGYDNSNIMTSRGGTKLKPEQIREAQNNRSTKKCTTENGKTACK
jgi:RHS repeat-associated protein